jgi:hypothetical protein
MVGIFTAVTVVVLKRSRKANTRQRRRAAG